MAQREIQRRQEREERRQQQRGRDTAEMQSSQERVDTRERRQRTQRWQRFLVRFAWVTGGLLAAGIVLWAIMATVFREQPGQVMQDLGNVHLQSLDEPHDPYNSTPPTSGPHLPLIAPANIYAEQLLDELQVHNLEDGFVLLQYDCPEGCSDLEEGLGEIVRSYLGEDRLVILAPYAEMGARIALTAWTRIDKFDELDEERVRAFIEAYEGIDHHVRGGA